MEEKPMTSMEEQDDERPAAGRDAFMEELARGASRNGAGHRPSHRRKNPRTGSWSACPSSIATSCALASMK